MHQPLNKPTLSEIFRIFLRIGFLGFGGPLATVSMIQDEVVQKRKWVSLEKFQHIYAVCKVLPGPISTLVATFVGWIQAGFRGGLIAGLCFILPGFIIVLLLSALYVKSGRPQTLDLAFGGLQAAALSVIALSIFHLGKNQNRPESLGIILIAGLITWNWPQAEPLVILLSGLMGALLTEKQENQLPTPDTILSVSKIVKTTVVISVVLSAGFFLMKTKSDSLSLFTQQWIQLAWISFKSGAFVFGSGLAIIPLLEADVVHRLHWLTQTEFMDGITVGQITPGPVLLTMTFIGYKTLGWIGAITATVMIFLPVFLIALVIFPVLLPGFWDRLHTNPRMRGFSEWAVPAVVGGVSAAGVKLGANALTHPILWTIFLTTLIGAFKFKSPAWLTILLGGAAGWIGQQLL